MPGTTRNKQMNRRGSKIMESASKLQYPTPGSPSEVSLPKLPVPDLQETLDQYLLCVRPLVNEGQFEQTKKKVEEFGLPGGIGDRIQEKLKKRAETQENWAYGWWLDDMYLNARVPLPVNSNPGMVLPRQEFTDQVSMLRYASKLVSGILDFKVILDARALPVDVARGQLAGQPLCMEQYYRLLTSYRLPGYGRDQLVSVKSDSVETEHIIVTCNNQLFVLPIFDEDRRLTEADFYVQLDKIVRNANNSNGTDSPVGILTSLNRNDWAEARELLMTDQTNRLSLDAVERCIFILCLDKPTNANSDVTMAHQMLYGSDPKLNSCNRWYDKTIQLIISSDGNVGLSYEHSASEGIAVTALIEHLIKYVSIQETKGLYRSDSLKTLPTPQRLKWRVNDATSKYVELAKSCAVEMAKNLELVVMRFQDYGKNFIKKQNISPDAFVQVALQVTYYKLYQRLVSTYESGSTRRFRKGRVDNIRAASIQALHFAKSLVESESGEEIKMDAKKMLLLRRAVKTQTDLTIAAISGHGIDCHLLALKKMAEEMNLPEPDIFTDPSYALSNYFQLSTSQIPTKTNSFMCYGAVVPDGYGVSYNPHEDSVIFCISSFRTCPSTCSEKFGNALRETMLTMRDICQQWNKRRSSSLEHLATPKKLPIHRPINIRHFSAEDETLRENGHEQTNEENKAILVRNLKRQTSFTSTNALRANERLPAPFSTRVRRPNRFKLSRRFSDMAITRPSVTHTHSTLTNAVISSELLELLRAQSIAT